jgi:NAD-dependent DNA ligase
MTDYDEDQELIKNYNLPLYIKKCVQELQGIAAAIIYDNQIDDNEIRMLIEWTDNHIDISEQFPISDLFDILQKIIDSGKCSNSQRKKLFELLSSFAADPQRPNVIGNIYDKNCTISFKEKTFQFTGKLEYGSRKKATDAVLAIGGMVRDTSSVSLEVDYLVVGELGNEVWKYSRFGSKIEKALEFRDYYKKPFIITEKQFINALIHTSGG